MWNALKAENADPPAGLRFPIGVKSSLAFPSTGFLLQDKSRVDYPWLWVCQTILCLILAISASFAQTPHFEHRKHLSEYNGPGRDDPAPQELTEVKIGYFGPDDPDHPVGGDIWIAANFAIDEINKEGGYNGRPFRLVQGWSENPWGSGISQVTRMVYEDQVWAIIGSIDGPSTHLAEQVVAKARVPLINPGSTDKTANLANVPWLFSFLPGEHLQIPLLTDYLLGETNTGKFILISSIDHDSRIFADELLRNLSRSGRYPVSHLELDPANDQSLDSLNGLFQPGVEAVVAAVMPEEGVELVRRIREIDTDVIIIGSPFFGRRLFLEKVGNSGEGIVLPYPGRIHTEKDTLETHFRQEWNRVPDFAARQTYDSVRFLAEAIRKTGLNRARIRDEIRCMAPWNGTIGIIDWDPIGQNNRPVTLARITNGMIQPLLEQ